MCAGASGSIHRLQPCRAAREAEQQAVEQTLLIFARLFLNISAVWRVVFRFLGEEGRAAMVLHFLFWTERVLIWAARGNTCA